MQFFIFKIALYYSRGLTVNLWFSFIGPVPNSVEVIPRKMSVREGESVIVACRTTGEQFDLRWSKERSRERINTVVSIFYENVYFHVTVNYLPNYHISEYSRRSCFEIRYSWCTWCWHVQVYGSRSKWFSKVRRLFSYCSHWYSF